jgi:hypothetical protein
MHRPRLLVALGCALLGYALLGNYVALPGYLRFLARGGTSAAGHAFDAAVVVGAAKTIAWMFSFQLGALCLASAHALRCGLPARRLVIACLAWLALWAWPSLPAPGAWFYVAFGALLLALVALVLLGRAAPWQAGDGRVLELGALLFFAFATWEVCGLGTAGRMLEVAREPLAQRILVTQSSKLMLELVVAWALLLASRAPSVAPASGGAPQRLG